MTAEFDWWLLILGLVIGAGLVWLILAELPRRDADLGPEELDVEAAWIAAQLRQRDRRWDAEMVATVLREHRAYLRVPPPDDGSDAGESNSRSLAPAAPASPDGSADRASGDSASTGPA